MNVSVRELRNEGGKVLDRVAAGEAVVVTRDGTPVAELRPLPVRGLSTAALIARWSNLPALDDDALRTDIDEIVDQSL